MEHFVWNIDPEIFQLGAFAPRWYGLLFAAGFLVGYQLMQYVYRVEDKKEEDLSSLLLHVMLGTVIGARLGHCLFYEPEFYLRHPLEILFIWKGGLASHGGTVGVMFAVWLYCRKHPDQTYMWIADRIAAPIAFAAGCIRLGNFFNSEIIGKPSDVPWAIVFERIDNLPRHPAMLYEALSYFMLAFVLWMLYLRKKSDVRPGSLIGLMFIWIFTARFFIEFVKENQVEFESGMALNMGQLLSIPFVILGIVLATGAWRKFFPAATKPTAKPANRRRG